MKPVSNKELLKMDIKERTTYFQELKKAVKNNAGEKQAKLREKQFKQMKLCMQHKKGN